MSKLFGMVWGWLFGDKWAERVIKEHQKAFPGRCPVCWFHRYGLQNGFTKDKEPSPHWCPEAKRGEK